MSLKINKPIRRLGSGDLNMSVVSFNSLQLSFQSRKLDKDSTWKQEPSPQEKKTLPCHFSMANTQSTGEGGDWSPQFSLENSSCKVTNGTNFLHCAAETTGVFPLPWGCPQHAIERAASLWALSLWGRGRGHLPLLGEHLCQPSGTIPERRIPGFPSRPPPTRWPRSGVFNMCSLGHTNSADIAI